MERFNTKIDISKRIVSFDEGIPDIALISNNIGLVRPQKSIVLKARHHVDVRVRLANFKYCNAVLLEPNPILAKKGIVGARYLVQPLEGKAVLRLLNSTNKNIKIYKSSILATVNNIGENSIMDLLDNEHSTPANPDGNVMSLKSEESHENELEFDLTDSDLPD
ncbi:hypothetical protein SNE40_009736 [Patella caerulea]|uniref:Uncharacterized protein n=1 Tax=Patella caerulea TaxID=87958 RepID=A0AAN8PYX0_PATCE